MQRLLNTSASNSYILLYGERPFLFENIIPLKYLLNYSIVKKNNILVTILEVPFEI